MLLFFSKTNYWLSKLNFRPNVSSPKVLSSSFTKFIDENLPRSSNPEKSGSINNSKKNESSNRTNKKESIAKPLDYSELTRNKPLSETFDSIFRQTRKKRKPFNDGKLPQSVYFQVRLFTVL